MKFSLTCEAFSEGQSIPEKYTCQGENISPPLVIGGVPSNTVSLVLIVHDPDAPGGDWLHWLLFNVSPETSLIKESLAPSDAVQGKTDFGNSEYGGPCPPSGTHRYFFDLHALDVKLGFASGATLQQVQAAMSGHILAKTSLVGLFSK